MVFNPLIPGGNKKATHQVFLSVCDLFVNTQALKG